MFTKLMFVLVIFTANGEAQRFATFDSMAQCETFAQGYNANNKGAGRAACVPENVQSEADMQRNFDQAMNMMEQFMDRMTRAVEQNKRKEL